MSETDGDRLMAPCKALPAQRWGFMPTDQFWQLAAFMPITFICFNLFALVWWQQALGFSIFYAIWGGLVERYGSATWLPDACGRSRAKEWTYPATSRSAAGDPCHQR